jgi:putative SOS response-associated peptidase YedK
MCGRYTLRRAALAYAAFDEKRIVPRFNIAPSQQIAIVRLKDQQRMIYRASWGFVPFWAKGKPKTKPINAKSETVASSGMFRQAFKSSRCLLPADGFYDWHGAKPPKQPYFIHKPDDEIFAFDGLCERWKPSPDAEPVDTCTIITTTPNATKAPIHNRMPVILAEADYAKWLDRETAGVSVQDLLRPYSGELLTQPISTRVNSVKNDGPDLIEPV